MLSAEVLLLAAAVVVAAVSLSFIFPLFFYVDPWKEVRNIKLK
jgi:hypothetical protein